LDRIIDEAIAKGEIKAEAKNMVGMIHTYSIGLVVESKVNRVDAKEHIDAFVDALFTFIQKKDIT